MVARGEYAMTLRVIQTCLVDGALRSVSGYGKVYELSATGQKLRKGMADLANRSIGNRDAGARSSERRHALNATRRIAEQNIAMLIPAAASIVLCWSKVSLLAVNQADRVQSPVRCEGDRGAICRPEWVEGELTPG